MAFEKSDVKTFEVLTEEIKTFNARIIHLIDMGSHEDSYEGKTTIKHSIRMGYELVDTAMSDGRPFMVSEEFNVTPSKYDDGTFYGAKTSNLKIRVNAITGSKKDYVNIGDLVALLGTPCRVVVKPMTRGSGAEAKTYMKVIDAMPAKGAVKEAVNPIVNAELSDEIPQNMKFIAERRAKALENTDPQRVKDWVKSAFGRNDNAVTSDFVPPEETKASAKNKQKKAPVAEPNEEMPPMPDMLDDIPF